MWWENVLHEISLAVFLATMEESSALPERLLPPDHKAEKHRLDNWWAFTATVLKSTIHVTRSALLL